MFRGFSRSRTALLGVALAVLAVGVVLGVALSGSAGGPTKAQYIARSNAICRTASARMAPMFTQIASSAAALAAGGGGTQQLAALVGRLHTEAASDLARLRALTEPTGDHAAIARFVTPLTTVVRAIGTAAADLRAGHALDAITMLEQMRPTAQQAASAARSYGLTECTALLPTLR